MYGITVGERKKCMLIQANSTVPTMFSKAFIYEDHKKSRIGLYKVSPKIAG